jgi:transcriptional regulator GlxA family with amidase domain
MSRAISLCDAGPGNHAVRSREPLVKRIGIILYDGFSLIGTGTLIETLRIANDLQRATETRCLTYSICFLSARGGAVSCTSSICVFTDRLSGQRLDFDALYIAGGTGAAHASKDDGLIDLLRIACSRNTAINALGNGEKLLSAAGLACNSRMSVEREILTRIYPHRPPTERSEALMYSLALVYRDLGHEVAVAVAEHLGCSNDQSVSSILNRLGTPTVAEKARESARWLERNCGNPVSVIDAARLAAMSERNFWRLFKREMGLTPTQYLLRARLQLSCELLANSELPIDKIARRTGLSNGERMSKLFRKEFAMSPSEYRAQKRHQNADPSHV